MFSSKFASWLFYTILAISFTPALLTNENDEKLYKLVQNFNAELTELNKNSHGKQVIHEGTNEWKMQKFIMGPFTEKIVTCLTAYINLLEQAGSKQEKIGKKLALCKEYIREIEVFCFSY
jgi:hypothetical protein